MQEHQTTHPEAIIPSHKLTEIGEASDLADETDLSEQSAENVLYLVETRMKNRADERSDIIVVFEEWAHADWSDAGGIADSPVILAGRVEDHSEKAWYARGAFFLQWDKVEDRPLDELEDEYVTDLIGQVDETDEEFIDRIAATYWPKKAVQGFYVIENDE